MTDAEELQPPHAQIMQDDNDPQQQLVVDTNDKYENEPILKSLHLTGVDDLTSNQIKQYIDLHIKPKHSYATRKEYAYLEYRLNWINDSEVNIVFDNNINIDRRGRERNEKTRTNLEENAGSESVDLMDDIKNVNVNVNNVNENNENNENNEDNEEMNDNTDDNMNDQSNNILKEELQDESIKGALDAITLLTDFQNIRNEHNEFAELSFQDQLSAVHQAPKLQDRKCWDMILKSDGNVLKTQDAKEFYALFEQTELGKQPDQSEKSTKYDAIKPEEITSDIPLEDFKIIHLEVRYSTKLDKKVKDARIYSRFYLQHGEPNRNDRLPAAREHSLDSNRYNEKDLITGEKPETVGLFGYSHDRNESDITDRRLQGDRSHKDDRRWKSDKYYDHNRRDTRYHGRNGGKNIPRYDNRSGRGRRGNRGYGGIQKRNHHNQRNPRSRHDEGDLFPDFGTS